MKWFRNRFLDLSVFRKLYDNENASLYASVRIRTPVRRPTHPTKVTPLYIGDPFRTNVTTIVSLFNSGKSQSKVRACICPSEVDATTLVHLARKSSAVLKRTRSP